MEEPRMVVVMDVCVSNRLSRDRLLWPWGDSKMLKSHMKPKAFYSYQVSGNNSGQVLL